MLILVLASVGRKITYLYHISICRINTNHEFNKSFHLNMNFFIRYELKGYDKNYEKYMTAFGIPSIIVSLIVGKPETLIVTEPDEDQSFYTIKKITGKK